MPDAIFAEPRLAEIYDPLDPDRSDLDVYTAIAEEFGARSVLDVGCGTGTLACSLAGRGLEVTAIDPASALRFRSRAELADSLAAASLIVEEVRDAPDRPRREFVFIAHRKA